MNTIATQRRRRLQAAGFSMIEVLISMVVVAVGLLGVAKLQAAAISNTQVARVRSLVALQASSLAAMMQSNRAFWGSATAVPPTASPMTVSGGTVSGLSTGTSQAVRALADAQAWATELNNHFPGATASVGCTNATNAPVSCLITIQWTERYVAINRTTAAGTASGTQSFTLYVENRNPNTP
ncbi:MAG: type IV pilus modification protein PilV [Burkholderiaceae bacterium]